MFFSKIDREMIPLLAEQYQYTLLLNLDKHLLARLFLIFTLWEFLIALQNKGTQTWLN